MEFINSEGFTEFSVGGVVVQTEDQLNLDKSNNETAKDTEKDPCLILLEKIYDAGILGKNDWDRSSDLAKIVDIFNSFQESAYDNFADTDEWVPEQEVLEQNAKTVFENIRRWGIVPEESVTVMEANLSLHGDILVAKDGIGSHYITGSWSTVDVNERLNDKVFIKWSSEYEEIVKGMLDDGGVKLSDQELKNLVTQVVIAHELGHAFEASLVRLIAERRGSDDHDAIMRDINRVVSEKFQIDADIERRFLSDDEEFLSERHEISEERIARGIEFAYLRNILRDKGVINIDELIDTHTKSQKKHVKIFDTMSGYADSLNMTVSDLWRRLNSLSSRLAGMTFMSVDYPLGLRKLTKKEIDFIRFDVRSLGYDYPLTLNNLNELSSFILNGDFPIK